MNAPYFSAVLNALAAQFPDPSPGQLEAWARHDRADRLFTVDRERILALIDERMRCDGPGAVVVRFDLDAGSPLDWFTYDPKRLAAMGVHPNAATGVWMRHAVSKRGSFFMIPIVFVDREGRCAYELYQRTPRWKGGE